MSSLSGHINGRIENDAAALFRHYGFIAMIFIPAILPCDQHNDPLYAFCPLVAHWQSFEQSLQNESQVEVEIGRNRMKAKNRTMFKSFFPLLLYHT